jgi:hypothetical protein
MSRLLKPVTVVGKATAFVWRNHRTQDLPAPITIWLSRGCWNLVQQNTFNPLRMSGLGLRKNDV